MWCFSDNNSARSIHKHCQLYPTRLDSGYDQPFAFLLLNASALRLLDTASCTLVASSSGERWRKAMRHT